MMDVDEGHGKQADNIDEGLYSRQLYVMGHEAQKAVGSASVLVVGANGLGVEIAKNVTLAGVKRIVVSDDTPATISDLGSQFYLTSGDIGKARGAVTAPKIAELNEYVSVDSHSGSVLDAIFLSQFTVVVLTLSSVDRVQLNALCREAGACFIAAQTAGLFAGAFCDFGEEFTVLDTNGEQPITRMISTILQENPAVVTVHDEQRHGLETGALVRFSEVQGMNELNQLESPVAITVKGPYTFEVPVDARGFGAYENGGYVHEVKQPSKIRFRPLSEALARPGDFLLTDFAKLGRSELLHFGFQALGEFQRRHGGVLPEPGNRAHSNEVVAIVEELNAKACSSSDNDAGTSGDVDMEVLCLEVDEGEGEGAAALDETSRGLIGALASGSSAELAPMTAFLGGVVGQEVLKACSGKFTPINQFLYFDAVECLPDGEVAPEQCRPVGSRYDGQIAVFGRDFVRRLNKLSMFLVGAGAIGCEMLKNWALMGVASAPDEALLAACGERQDGAGVVHVTDMDKIERSNLNRQFLFRPSDVGSSKSVAAARAVAAMNPSTVVKAYEDKCDPETETVFGDDFMASLDVVCTALDNVEARLYIDQRCLNYAKPMLESGTLGTKGNTQVVVPRLTENYGASRDPPEKSVPVCTLKHFPYEIAHCVQWARDWFEGAFSQTPRNANQYLTNPDFLSRLDAQQNVKVETLEALRSALLTDRPTSFEQCIAWARLEFEKHYGNQIKQLLFNFPPGMLTSTKAPFWSGTKRQPQPLEFDANDSEHLAFVIAAANLRAFNYSLHGDRDPARFKAVLKTVDIPPFVPKSNVKIAASDAEIKEQAEAGQAQNEDLMDVDQLADKILADLPKPKDLAGVVLPEADFEKDDDTNFHIDFITAASNLRARNYRIKEANKHETKRIAGRIIPAIATTTALVTGLVCIELYKLAQGKDKVEAYKNGFCNLALPFFAFSEPIEVKKIIAGDLHWSIWDKIDIDGIEKEYTLADFLKFFTDKYKVEVNMLSHGNAILHSFFSNPQKKAERMRMTMKELVENVTKKQIDSSQKFLTFEVLCVDEDDNDVELPPVRYKIR